MYLFEERRRKLPEEELLTHTYRIFLVGGRVCRRRLFFIVRNWRKPPEGLACLKSGQHGVGASQHVLLASSTKSQSKEKRTHTHTHA